MNFTKRVILLISFATCHLFVTVYFAMNQSPCANDMHSRQSSLYEMSGKHSGPVQLDPLANPEDINLDQVVRVFPLAKPNLGVSEAKLLKEYKYEVDIADPSYILHPDLTPNNVFYIWCGRRWFEFHHYIAMLSVIKELRPDNIIFYYDFEPVVDYWLYNTWFREIRDEYPFIILEQLNPADKACTGHDNVSMTFVENLLKVRGGMWISEKTMIARYPIKFRNYTFIDAFNTNDKSGFIVAKVGATRDNVRDVQTASVKKVYCSTIPDFVKAQKKPLCVSANPVYFPKDIWDLQNSFGGLVRRIFYGYSDVPVVQKSSDTLIPNIAHVVWIGGGEMDYLFYLCILSLIYVAEVDTVYLHGNGPPTGPLWEKIKNEPKLRLIYRETPRCVFGTEVKVLSHVTDIYRVDFMMRYGGIYVDTDTIFARKLDDDIRSYDAVGAYDWTYWNHPFPDTINFGVAIGKRNVEYWKRFQESMKWFIDHDWSWNGLRQPYRIKERHPELVKIDPRLQVICFEFKCHPTWWQDYHNESVHHLNSNSLPDWQNDAYSYHFTLPTPPELLSEEALLQSNSIIGEMGKNVLIKAGILKLNS